METSTILNNIEIPDFLIRMAYQKEISSALEKKKYLAVSNIIARIKQEDRDHYKAKTIGYVIFASLAAVSTLASVLTTAPSLSFWFSAAGISDEALALSLAHGIALLSAGMIFYVSLRTTRLIKGWIDRGLFNIPDEDELDFSTYIKKAKPREKEERKIAFLVGLLICIGAGSATAYLSYETMRLFYHENLPAYTEKTPDDAESFPHSDEAILFIAIVFGLISSVRLLSHWAGFLRSHGSFENAENENADRPFSLAHKLGMDPETNPNTLITFGLIATLLCFGTLTRSLQQGSDLGQEDTALELFAFALLTIAHLPMLSRGLGFLFGCLQDKKYFSLGKSWQEKTLWSASLLAQIFISASVAMIGVCVLFEETALEHTDQDEASILPVDETIPDATATSSPAFNRFQFYAEPEKLALQVFSGATAAITVTGNRLRSCEVKP